MDSVEGPSRRRRRVLMSDSEDDDEFDPDVDHRFRMENLKNCTPRKRRYFSDSDEGEFDLAVHDSAAVDDEEKGVSLVKKPRAKRRKPNTAGSGQPAAKKVRGKRGGLKQLVEMPLDVTFEIFGRLEPIDLLHLTWTTKELRNLLMTRSSTSIWKEARSNIPGVPECPPDMSEPQYANFLFGKSCHFCQRNLSNMHIVWSARFRACTKCIDHRFNEKASYHWELYRGYPSELASLVPTVTIVKKSGRHNREREKYYPVIDDLWKREHTLAKDKDKWLKDKLQEAQAIDQHAKACSTWFAQLQILRDQERAKAIEDRKAMVVERIRQLGWADELDRLSERSYELPQDHPVVTKACQKEITPRILSNLEELITSFMEHAQATRLAKERKDMLKERLPVLNTVLNTYISTLPANALHPNIGELFRCSIVQDIMNTSPTVHDITTKHFDALVPMLPDVTRSWQEEIEQKLLDLIRDAVPDYTFDPDTVLHLATTTFTCSTCITAPMRIPRVLMHSCATKARWSMLPDGGDEKTVMDILSERYWNTALVISFKRDDLEVMNKVIELCGFDPKLTTAAEMDAVDPIIECLTCNDINEGRPTMTWSKVLHHYRRVHHGREIKMELELLKEPEAAIVRPRMAEMLAKKKAQKHCMDLVCCHCKLKGNMPDLVKHVKTQHDKAAPTSEDIQPVLDTDHLQIPDVFFLWPPREQV